jgi:ArsR family transcriptional regulator, arsenate/arsenite/antimonite-responsive transcriptional repressor
MGATQTRPARSTRATQPCCSPIQESVLNEDDATELAVAFAALADPARLRLLSLIANAADGEACACDLIEPIGKSQPTVSHHLKILVDAGLITREKRGVWAWYRADTARLADLRTVLG